MNHELAKELKDAGFPQEHQSGVMMDMNQMDKPFSEKEFDYAPTLSELIEACGRDFKFIHRDEYYDDGSLVHVRWLAHSADYSVADSTPDEAVAQLWLALNPPDSKEIT